MSPSRSSALLLALLLAGCSSSAASGGSGSESDSSATAMDGGAGDAPAHDDGSSRGDAGGDSTLSTDSGTGSDAAGDASGDGNDDGGSNCEVFGAPGDCIDTSACAALGNHTSYAGHCPGPANIECCIVTPNVADNPPVPAGWVLMQQSMVTAAMTSWAVMILDDPTGYPMFSESMMTFGSQLVMARVEWHPPDFQNSVVHRGVTLYVPTD